MRKGRRSDPPARSFPVCRWPQNGQPIDGQLGISIPFVRPRALDAYAVW